MSHTFGVQQVKGAAPRRQIEVVNVLMLSNIALRGKIRPLWSDFVRKLKMSRGETSDYQKSLDFGFTVRDFFATTHRKKPAGIALRLLFPHT